MDYTLQIQKLMIKMEATDSPDDKIRLLKEAVNIADAHNDIEWAYDLRMEIMDEEFYTSHCNESMQAFTWLLEANDNNPDMFDVSDLLWKYKWMIGAARRTASISMPQLEAICDDFKSRLEKGGYSLRPYYGQMYYITAFAHDDKDGSRKFIEMRDAAQRDPMADCKACELDDNICLELEFGNIDKAVTLAHDLFNGKLSCSHVPFITYCNFLEYFIEKGDYEGGVEYFNKAESQLLEMENDSSQIGNIGSMIHFLTTHNRKKAWEYFEKYIHWSISCEESTLFDIAIDLLPLLKTEQTHKLNVNSQMPWFRTDGVYQLSELYTYYHTKALDLAKQFDTRNGNGRYMRQLSEILAKM